MAQINVRPLHDRVLVRRLEDDEKTTGGIYIPDTAKEKPSRGEVVAAGNGKLLENGETRPLDVKVGNVVLFGKYAGTEVKVADTDYLVMREDDIMGVIEA